MCVIGAIIVGTLAGTGKLRGSQTTNNTSLNSKNGQVNTPSQSNLELVYTTTDAPITATGIVTIAPTTTGKMKIF